MTPMVSRGIFSRIDSISRSLSMFQASFGVQKGMIQRRNGQSVIALDIETLSAVGHGSDQNRFPRPIVIARIGLWRFAVQVAFQREEIKSGRRKMAYFTILLMSHVAGHSEGFQINFRPHDGGTEIEQYTSFEARD